MTDGRSGSPTVRELGDSDGDDGRWDAFVATSDEATFFHRSGWRRVFASTLGHRCHYLMAEADGEVRGVLPLVHVDSLLFGKALVSAGFLVLGGPAAADAAARDALDSAAVALADRLGVDHLEYRLRAPMHADWPVNATLYAYFRKPIAPDVDANLKAIPRKQRAVVRKGLGNGLQVDEGAGVDRFYQVFSESYRDLGTPVLHKRFFEKILAVFGADAEIVTVSHDGRVLCSVLVFFHRDQVMPYFGGGIRAARDFAAYDVMYWETMKRACERGYRVFDFGRSKRGSGAYEFKRHWGFEPEPLYYEYKLFKRRDVPNLNTQNPKYEKAIALWRKLPLGVANRLGPLVARELA